MAWFEDLYDDFRMKWGFGRIPEERTKREVDFLCDVLRLSVGAKVLDLFCGVGRHSVELTRRGCTSVGVDLNADYLELAQERARQSGVSPCFVHGDARYLDFGKGYDAAIIMYHSFGYFTDEEDRALLQKVCHALKAHGRFLIETLSRDWLLKNFLAHEQTEIGGIRLEEGREFDTLTSRCNFTIRRYEKDGVVAKVGSWRFYSADEIKTIAADIGLTFVAGYHDLDKKPLTRDTRLMRLVFAKS